MNALEKKADRLWSEFIRKRDARCMAANHADEWSKCWGPLAAHHLFRRSFKATRWDPRNGATLCAYHHGEMHNHPLQHAVWRIDLRGEVVASELLRRAYGGEKPDVAAIVASLEGAA